MSNSNPTQDNHNRGGMLAFMFSMVFVFCFFIYIVVIHPGVDLGENVSDPEPQTAAAAAGPAFDPSSVAEPWVSSPEMITYGQKLYSANCTLCHGPKGMGDGPGGAGLNPKPRNLVEGKWTQGGGEISHFKVLTDGIKGSSMAPYGSLPVHDRWALVHFIESITQNKSKDTAEELKQFGATAK